MRPLFNYLRDYKNRRHVRPWAIAAPIAVLLVCLPLMRPLRHPLISSMSDDELARWGTVQALVEQQTFCIDQTPFVSTRQRVRLGEATYSDQPPVMGLMLSGPYWVMHRLGYSFSANSGLVEYLLTLFAVTLPVAAAAGMIYRMGRLFELSRPWRTGLAFVVVFGSGLLSYATVLNPYAPAAALVLLSAAILVQVSRVHSPLRSGGYLISAGFFAALAAAIDPAAVVFTILFPAVILCARWRWSVRIGGVLMYCIGLAPPVLLHLSLSLPITGDFRLGLAPIPAVAMPHHLHVYGPPVSVIPPTEDGAAVSTLGDAFRDDDSAYIAAPPSLWHRLGGFLSRLIKAFVGTHGLLTHFPVLLLGMAGATSVIRRHWPFTTKTLAIITAAGGSIVLVRYLALPIDWRWAMYGARWYILFMPLLLFWAGAWVRKEHSSAVWITAGVLMAFSTIVSLIGATDPTPRQGYNRYPPLAVLEHWLPNSAAESSALVAAD